MTQAYRFRLAAVLRLRRAELDQAELALSGANRRLRHLIEARDEAHAHCRAIDAATGEQSKESFSRQRAGAALAASTVLGLEKKVNVAAAEAALAHINWSAANQRVATLERLDERRKADWFADNARREANELDELATAAFVREHFAIGAGS